MKKNLLYCVWCVLGLMSACGGGGSDGNASSQQTTFKGTSFFGPKTANGLSIAPTHISSDQSGNIYLTDGTNILKVNTSGSESTINLTDPPSAIAMTSIKGIAADNSNIYLSGIENPSTSNISGIFTYTNSGSYASNIVVPNYSGVSTANSLLYYAYINGGGSGYVKDGAGNSIQIFDAPAGIAVLDNLSYVVTPNGASHCGITYFSLNTNKTIIRSAQVHNICSSLFNSPSDISIAPNGDLYVINVGNSNVLKVSGGVVSVFLTASDGLCQPAGITVIQSNLYVANSACTSLPTGPNVPSDISGLATPANYILKKPI